MEVLVQTYVDKQLRNAYGKGHKQFIDSTELKLREFVASENKQLLFPELDSFQRKLLHRLCERYNLDKEVRSQGEDKANMTVRKGDQPPRMANKTVVEIIEAKKETEYKEYKVEAAKPKKILLRQKNSDPDRQPPIPQQKVMEIPPKPAQTKQQTVPQVIIQATTNNAVFANDFDYDPDYDRNDYSAMQYKQSLMYMQFGYPMQYPMAMQQIPYSLPAMPPPPRKNNYQQNNPGKQRRYPNRNPQQQDTEAEPVPAAPKFNYDQKDFPQL